MLNIIWHLGYYALICQTKPTLLGCLSLYYIYTVYSIIAYCTIQYLPLALSSNTVLDSLQLEWLLFSVPGNADE